MRNVHLGLRALPLASVAAALFCAATPVSAAQRTFVHSAPLGNDGNAALTPPCTQAAPCRTFAGAMPVTDPGGEIVILDTAGYGAVTITKSLKIVGPAGVYGGVTVGGATGTTTGIVINAGPNDVVTLSGLNINGLTTAPLPLFGIDVHSAGVVHIDHVTVSNFTDPAGACINAAPTAPVQVYVDDSMLRECRTGINANGTGVASSGDLVVLVDNARIELSRATSGPAYGLWVQGFAAATVRNSVISLNQVGIQFNNIATNGNPILVLSQTQLIGSGTCLNVDSTAVGGVPIVYIDGGQFLGCDDGIVFSHTAAGTTFGAQLKITDSKFDQMNNGGITVSTGSDVGVSVDLVRSRLHFIGTTAVSLTAGGTFSGINFHMRDSTLSNAPTLLKTAGTTGLNVTLIRSHLHNSVKAVDHGLGRIRMEQTNVSVNQKSLVNSGSPNIVSAGNNWIVDNGDPTDGTVYITPAIYPMK